MGLRGFARAPEIERVMRRLDTSDPEACWEWPGARHPSGYGSVQRVGRNSRQAVHRVTYEAFVGPIPDGYHIDHLCRNPPCANPAHLEAVTPWENTRRGQHPTAIRFASDVCAAGHPFDEANTYRTKAGKRVCRACHRADMAARRAGLKGRRTL